MRHFGRKPFSWADCAKHWTVLSYFVRRSGINYGMSFWSQFSTEQLENYFNRLAEVE